MSIKHWTFVADTLIVQISSSPPVIQHSFVLSSLFEIVAKTTILSPLCFCF